MHVTTLNTTKTNSPSCYTNHALDQFLEHLLSVTKNIVRIGSASNSEILKQYNLRELVFNQQGILKSGSERWSEKCVHTSIDEKNADGTIYCEQLSDRLQMHWHEISGFLEQNYPHHYAQLRSEPSKDGFVTVGSKGGSFFKFWKHCHDLRRHSLYENEADNHQRPPTRREPRGLDELLAATSNIWNFSERERNILLRHWAEQMRQKWIDKLILRAEEHHELHQELHTLRAEYQRRVLENAHIIGLTTTGLARHMSLLEKVNPQTLICEEAGEVLEVRSNV